MRMRRACFSVRGCFRAAYMAKKVWQNMQDVCGLIYLAHMTDFLYLLTSVTDGDLCICPVSFGEVYDGAVNVGEKTSAVVTLEGADG
jgi:hypothetical protein